jgi:hypothetical protein
MIDVHRSMEGETSENGHLTDYNRQKYLSRSQEKEYQLYPIQNLEFILLNTKEYNLFLNFIETSTTFGDIRIQ